MRSLSLVASCVLVAGAATVGPRTAAAQAPPSFDDAARLVDDADFESARSALQALADAGGFSREDAIRWLSLETIVEYALTGQAPRRLLSGLLSLAPDYQLPETVSPDVRRVLDELRASSPPALELGVAATSGARGFTLRAVVTNDAGSIVTGTRLFARAAGETSWRTSQDTSFEIQTDADEISYYAIAFGPGGAEVARHGSEAAALVLRGSRPEAEAAAASHPALAVRPEEGQPRDEGGSSLGLVLGLTGAGLVIAGVVVALLLLLLPTSPDSPLEPPTFEPAAFRP